MDRALDLFEEYDLTPEELYAKRRAEFDRWFDKPHVRLYEAVMLSLRIIPQSEYRLGSPLAASHPPRYPDEFFFKLCRVDFHSRMVLAVGAVRAGALKSQQNTNSAIESEHRITLAEFERWANKANLNLPPEWARKALPSKTSSLTSAQRRERNNLLRIIRALLRKAQVQDEETFWSVVHHAPLLAPIDRPTVATVLRTIPLADRHVKEMSPAERSVVQQTPNPEELVGVIAALTCVKKLQINLRQRKGAAKRIAGFVYDDHHALGVESAISPGIDKIEQVVEQIRAALADGVTTNPT